MSLTLQILKCLLCLNTQIALSQDVEWKTVRMGNRGANPDARVIIKSLNALARRPIKAYGERCEWQTPSMEVT